MHTQACQVLVKLCIDLAIFSSTALKVKKIVVEIKLPGKDINTEDCIGTHVNSKLKWPKNISLEELHSKSDVELVNL